MIRRNNSFSDDQRVLVTNYQESEVLDNTYGNEDTHYHQQSSNLPSLPSLPSIDDTESVNSVSPTDINKFQSTPVDRLNFNFLGFYLLGIVTMVPWNFFITAEDVSCFAYHAVPYQFVEFQFLCFVSIVSFE